jgi:hypothetical protein
MMIWSLSTRVLAPVVLQVSSSESNDRPPLCYETSTFLCQTKFGSYNNIFYLHTLIKIKENFVIFGALGPTNQKDSKALTFVGTQCI